ncbi:tRNA pseudouridine(55) synthase TruB [Coriobacteriales bacterium OH1046]|nr:tRNA pseudouridine(55) synthase TruB [Coriobacteriales bacterium OH1046]
MKRISCGHSFLLGVDKPVGLSSHGAVAQVRRSIGESRVGHAGTLDPAASGVLLMGVGQATRLLGIITLDDKRYRARIAFGSETATDDAEGAVIRTAPVGDELFDEGYARAALAALEGTHEQVPPAFSAISVEGTRAYALARKGEEPELAPRPITIHGASLASIGICAGIVTWTCEFHVSKGTYIRSLARDLGRRLGSAAYLSGLERTASGTVGIDDCIGLGQLDEGGLELALARALDPLRVLPYPHRPLTSDEHADVLNGRPIRLRGSERACLAGDGIVCLVRAGRLWGIWERRGSHLVSLSTFPQGIEGVRL